MARGPVQATVYDQSGSKQLDVGTLLPINNQAATTTGTVQLKAILPNEHRPLWPGTFVNVDLADLSRSQCTDDPHKFSATERQRAIRVCCRRRQTGVGPAGRGCAAAARGCAHLEGARGRRDRRRSGPIPADAGDARRSDGAMPRRRTPRPPVPGCCREPLQRFHNQADRNHAPDGRGRGAGDRQLSPASRRCVAEHRHADEIQVTAQMPGADPQTMASSVTTQLERQFGEIPGLSQMTSSSGTGFVEITLQFDRSRTIIRPPKTSRRRSSSRRPNCRFRS